MVNEHRERKRNERPQVPRKARKMSAAKMESAMEELGVTIQNKEDVRLDPFYTSGHQNIFQVFYDFALFCCRRTTLASVHSALQSERPGNGSATSRWRNAAKAALALHHAQSRETSLESETKRYL